MFSAHRPRADDLLFITFFVFHLVNRFKAKSFLREDISGTIVTRPDEAPRFNEPNLCRSLPEALGRVAWQAC
jgi:hypothetical protein